LDRIREWVAPGKWFVIAGSLPAGVAPEFVGELIRVVHAGGGLVAVDSSGAALKVGIEAGADLAKPNTAELSEYLGADLSDIQDTVKAARELRREKTSHLVVSLGGEGALFLTPEAELMASAPRAKVISTVGAGDSLLAGFLFAKGEKNSPADCARLATVFAWNRLESLFPGLPNRERMEEQMQQISVEPLNG
jgi:1-phosphofructokinase family hexose kinase